MYIIVSKKSRQHTLNLLYYMYSKSYQGQYNPESVNFEDNDDSDLKDRSLSFIPFIK